MVGLTRKKPKKKRCKKFIFNELETKLKKIKKGEQVFTFFCPKSTMNLTYLCYGDTKLDGIC